MSRTALLVHLPGCVLPLAGFAAISASMQDGGDTATAIGGMLVAMSIGFWFWTVTLLARALWRGEGLNLFVRITAALLLLEINLPALASWSVVPRENFNFVVKWWIWLGLPVFVPVFSFVAVAAAAVAHAASRKIDAGKRFRAWLKWFAPVAAMLTLVLLPWPLFFFCVYSPIFTNDAGAGRSWGGFVAAHTPVFVRDSVDHALRGHTHRTAKMAVRRQLRAGWMSARRFEELMPDSTALTALDWMSGFCKSYPAECLQFVKHERTKLRSILDPYYFGYVLGRDASAEGIQPVLGAPGEYDPSFIEGVLCALLDPRRPRFVEEVSKLADRDEPYRRTAVILLARQIPEAELESYWKTRLTGPGEKTAATFAGGIGRIESWEIRYRLFEIAMKHKSPLVRRAAALSISSLNFYDLKERSPELELKLAVCFAAMLDSNDPCLARVATMQLAVITGHIPTTNYSVDRDMGGLPHYSDAMTPNGDILEGAEPKPLEPIELRIISSLREFSQKWLKKQEK